MERVKLLIAKEFRCEYSQMQLTFAVLNTIMEWAIFKIIFN